MKDSAFTSILDQEKVITVDILLFISSSQALSCDWREPESLSPSLMGSKEKGKIWMIQKSACADSVPVRKRLRRGQNRL